MNAEAIAAFNAIHSGLDKEAPGDDASTRRAFNVLSLNDASPTILDVGCGPGRQTLQLAALTKGTITAVDINEDYIRHLQQKVDERGLATKVRPQVGDMAHLNVAAESFDIIWAEGAIYVLGFETGLRLWRPFLKLEGYVVLTELSWLTDTPSKEATAFWQEAYPVMTTIAGNKQAIDRAGYELVDSFPLPAEAWWSGYYDQIGLKLDALRQQYSHSVDAKAVIDQTESEIDLFRKHSSDYGYVFYIAKRKK